MRWIRGSCYFSPLRVSLANMELVYLPVHLSSRRLDGVKDGDEGIVISVCCEFPFF